MKILLENPQLIKIATLLLLTIAFALLIHHEEKKDDDYYDHTKYD